MKFVLAIIAIGLRSTVEGHFFTPDVNPEARDKVPIKAPDRPPVDSPIISPSVPPPTYPPFPTYPPTTATPSSSPSESCDLTCQVDVDCPSVCEGAVPGGYLGTPTPGTCVPSSSPPSVPTTPPPTLCPCKDPSNIPDKCEVEILIDLMETAVLGQHSFLAQWTRAAFHDAGTFNQTHGGANGCLMNFIDMRLEPENDFLDAPLNTLAAIKEDWHDDAMTCIKVSSADMLQFAIFFAVTRQRGTPESLLSGTSSALNKRNDLISEFKWGRPDEQNCDTLWVDNLPGFQLPTSGPLNAGRCTGASEEIQEKMIDRNGFTAEEATVLIGAHTIGLIRNTFGSGHAGPWVMNGADNATPDGPVFDNKYHDFLINDIVKNTCEDFVLNPLPSIAPFDQIFPNWFRDNPNDLDHLDTDIALAFPPVGGATHPNFRVHSVAFADDNDDFLAAFDNALHKMSHLGVNVDTQLATACEDPCGGDDGGGGVGNGGTGPHISLNSTFALIKKLGNATAFADAATFDIQERRIEKVKKLTTPLSDQPIETTTTRGTIPVVKATMGPTKPTRKHEDKKRKGKHGDKKLTK